MLARRSVQGIEVNGLQELITYGVKGASAYAAHAQLLGKEDPKIYADLQSSLSFIANNDAKSIDRGALLGEALKVGATNINVLALLEDAHTSRYGHPV